MGNSINYLGYDDFYPDYDGYNQSSTSPRNELPQYNDTLLEDLLNVYFNRYLSCCQILVNPRSKEVMCMK